MKFLKSRINLKVVILIIAFALAGLFGGLFAGVNNGNADGDSNVAFASGNADTNYWFPKIDVSVDVNEDKTMVITENMLTRFDTSNVNTGFIRDIQRITQIKRTVNGEVISGEEIFTSLTDISLTVYDENMKEVPSKFTYSLYDEGQFHSIKMQKSSGYFLAGDYLFSLTYTYGLGDDKAAGFDDLTLDVLGYDMAHVDLFHAKVNFPKPIANHVDTAVFLNLHSNFSARERWEPKLNADKLEIGESSIEFTANTSFYKNRSFTVQVILPDGYFSGAGKTFFWYYIPIVLLAAAAVVALAVLAVKMLPKKPLQTVEFYPPKGVSVMRFSAIWHRGARERDVAALILKWAGAGLLTIEQDGARHIILRPTAKVNLDGTNKKRKKRTLPQEVFEEFAPPQEDLFATARNDLTEESVNEESLNGVSVADNIKYFDNSAEKNYYKTLFSGIGGYGYFSSREYNSSSYSSQRKLYEVAKQLIDAADSPAVVHELANKTRFLIPYLSLVPMILAMVYQCILTSTFMPMFFAIFMAAGTFVLPSAGKDGSKIILLYIFPLAFFFMPYGIFVTMFAMPAYDYIRLLYIAPAIWAVGNFVLPHFNGRRTDEANKLYGQMLGFKNFLLKAELPRIQKLFDENPEYFSDILPWCYIMGISDKVQTRFAALNFRMPAYIQDNINVAVVSSCILLSNHRGAPRSSSGGGGFGGGGGGHGGSSGGGGGGGGSRGC